jgi:hypothetical protein
LAAQKEKELADANNEIAELRRQLEELAKLTDLGMNHAEHQLFEMQPFLGLEIGEPSAGGVKVLGLLSTMLGSDSPYSPAADAGIRSGDEIMTIGWMPITSAEEFRRVELVLAVGDAVPVQIRRADGEVATVTVEVGGEGVPFAILQAIRELAVMKLMDKVTIKPGDTLYHKILGDAKLIAVRRIALSLCCCFCA